MSDKIEDVAFKETDYSRADGANIDSKAIKYSATSRANFRKKVAKLAARAAASIKGYRDAVLLEETTKLAQETNLSNSLPQVEKVIKKYGKVVKLDALLGNINTITAMADISRPKPIKISSNQFKKFGLNSELLMALFAAKEKEFITNSSVNLTAPTPDQETVESRVGNYMEAMSGVQAKINEEIKSESISKPFYNDTLEDFHLDNKSEFNNESNTKDPLNDFNLDDKLGVTTKYVADITKEQRDLGIEALDAEIGSLKEKELPELSVKEDQAKNQFQASEEELRNWEKQLEVTRKEVEEKKALERAKKARELATLKQQQSSFKSSIAEYDSKTQQNLNKAAALKAQIAALMADASVEENVSQRGR